jgi:hypothetical protein
MSGRSLVVGLDEHLDSIEVEDSDRFLPTSGSSNPSPPEARSAESKFGDVAKVIALLFALSSMGLAFLVFPALAKFFEGDTPGALLVLSAGLFTAGGADLLGAVIGFLFGVPRARRKSRRKQTGSTAHTPNTNLEHVSDWLTKIVVGVTLVEFADIKLNFVALAEFLGPAFDDENIGVGIAGGILLHYLCMGFLQGFLISYLWLPSAFRRLYDSRASSNFE